MTGVKIALNESLFATPLELPEKVRLRGSKCNNCGVAFFGKLVACENCQSTNITEYQLPRYGKLYSYTVVRQKPPGGYRGPTDPFEPFPVGQVEMEDGVLFLSRLAHVKFEDLKIGMDLEMVVEPLYVDENGNEVMMFAFQPRGQGR
jgi:uncharacterized OB-fold protein